METSLRGVFVALADALIAVVYIIFAVQYLAYTNESQNLPYAHIKFSEKSRV